MTAAQKAASAKLGNFQWRLRMGHG
jgi:hypothetical protein